MKWLAMVFGVVIGLLGGLWLLQGLGLVHVRPILCFANCADIQGPSLAWTIIGTVVFAAGGLAFSWSLRRRAT